MALTSGFYTSYNNDRLYNADQVTKFFEGLVSANGIYESVGNAFIVKASSGLTLTVGEGRGLVNYCWVKNDADMTITLNPANVALPRYTAIVLRNSVTNREITLEMIDGTAASTPLKPAIVRNNEYFDILLAYVYVGASATAITQANITDMRANTNVCGWITGVIKQVDTSELFIQWQTAYEQYYSDIKTQLDDFMQTLTEELKVNTYINNYEKYVTVTASDSKIIPLDMTGYSYESTDVLLVYFNGLAAAPTVDYLLDTRQSPPELHVNLVGSTNARDEIYIVVLKSVIGIAALVDNIGNEITTSSGDNVISS